MSIEHLKPEGFTDEMRTFALWTRPSDMYVQGFFNKEFSVWLRIDGMQTMIGFGDLDTALQEAENWAADQLANVRAQIEARRSEAGITAR